jgi:AcrR family transcriptional regulator
MTIDRSVDPGVPPGVALVWGFPPPTRRGPKPAYTVTQIIEAARDLADEEGSAGLSLPRIARRLGLTANALYRYVSSKDELLLLLVDASVGPPPQDLPEVPWRAGAATWVRTLFDRYGERPWLLDIPVHGAPVTPNLLRWLETLLAVLARSGLRERDWLSCAVLLDGYARSTATLSRDLGARDRAPAESAAMATFLSPLLQERGFPIVATMLAGGRYEDAPATGLDIDFGLDRILDGIETWITRPGPER